MSRSACMFMQCSSLVINTALNYTIKLDLCRQLRHYFLLKNKKIYIEKNLTIKRKNIIIINFFYQLQQQQQQQQQNCNKLNLTIKKITTL